jgi:putative Mg2+ transporter-C (MgtC) family protein
VISYDVALARLGLALVFGALIGVERELRHKNAGLKTNTLVALGSAAFAMVSNTFGPLNHNPAQIAAAVVTGIGFIGAGVIIHRGAAVQGVTTAATLWANAAVGLTVGLGQTRVGTILFLATLLVQITMRWLGAWIARIRREGEVSRVELSVECECRALPRINGVWKAHVESLGLTIVRRVTTQRDLRCSWRTAFVSPGKGPIDLSELEEEIAAVDGVHRIESRFLGYEEPPDAVM